MSWDDDDGTYFTPSFNAGQLGEHSGFYIGDQGESPYLELDDTGGAPPPPLPRVSVGQPHHQPPPRGTGSLPRNTTSNYPKHVLPPRAAGTLPRPSSNYPKHVPPKGAGNYHHHTPREPPSPVPNTNKDRRFSHPCVPVSPPPPSRQAPQRPPKNFNAPMMPPRDRPHDLNLFGNQVNANSAPSPWSGHQEPMPMMPPPVARRIPRTYSEEDSDEETYEIPLQMNAGSFDDSPSRDRSTTLTPLPEHPKQEFQSDGSQKSDRSGYSSSSAGSSQPSSCNSSFKSSGYGSGSANSLSSDLEKQLSMKLGQTPTFGSKKQLHQTIQMPGFSDRSRKSSLGLLNEETMPSPSLRPSSPAMPSFESPAASPKHTSGTEATPQGDKPWYHGDISREGAQQILNSCCNKSPGTFIVRLGKSAAKPYTLSIYTPEKIWHLQIRCVVDEDDHKRFAVGTKRANEKHFDCLEALVKYHKKHKIRLAGSQGLSIVLTNCP